MFNAGVLSEFSILFEHYKPIPFKQCFSKCVATPSGLGGNK